MTVALDQVRLSTALTALSDSTGLRASRLRGLAGPLY